MLKRILPLTVLGAAIIGNSACNGGGDFKKLHGVDYKIVKDEKGKTAKMGDIVEFNLIASVDTLDPATKKMNSMEVANTYKQGRPAPQRVEEVKQPGQFQSLFPLLSKGDSVLVNISCDTILATLTPDQKMRVPSWLKSGNKVSMRLSIVSVQSMEDYQKNAQARQEEMQRQMKEKAEKQMPIDDKTLQDYFAKNNIKAEKTASGLYYTVQKPGSGEQIKAGQMVTMMYTGKLLDGKEFDSNIDTAMSHHGDPLVFAVGAHQMIAGVDEGVALLKKGSKATLYLPSPLGYGENAPPNIGPNAILIFEVDIKDVKEGGPKGGPGGPGGPGGAMPRQVTVPKPGAKK